MRLLTDLSIVTSGITLSRPVAPSGFATSATEVTALNYDQLIRMYKETAGLPADKLKHLLEFVWVCLKPHGISGVIFPYDEAQTMSDHAEKEQFPLSLLLDVFQSIQKKVPG